MTKPLSRDEMVGVIRGGGSVIHEGILHTSVDTLPTEADLASGNAEKTADVLAGIAAQRAALDAQEQKLLAAQGRQAAASAGEGDTPDPNAPAKGGKGKASGNASDPNAPAG